MMVIDMEASNVIDFLEDYVKYYIEEKNREISFYGVNILPDDACSSRGILPLIFQKIRDDSELCKRTMLPDIYYDIFGWMEHIDIVESEETLLGIRLKPVDRTNIQVSKYMILSCCHKALDEIYDLYPADSLKIEFLCKENGSHAEIRPA